MSPSYSDLSEPFQSPLNTPVTLPLLRPTALCYYVVTSTVINFEIRGNFHTLERKLNHKTDFVDISYHPLEASQIIVGYSLKNTLQ